MLSYNMASIATQLQAQLELLVTGKCYNPRPLLLVPFRAVSDRLHIAA
jgi:hypothetical protein